MQRNSILRTNFHSKWNNGPLQVVYRHKRNGLTYEDLREMNEKDREAYVAEYTRADKIKGFDLSQDVLMRISILQMHDQTYRFIWNYHHILMDGWCLSLVIGVRLMDTLLFRNNENWRKGYDSINTILNGWTTKIMKNP